MFVYSPGAPETLFYLPNIQIIDVHLYIDHTGMPMAKRNTSSYNSNNFGSTHHDV